MAVKLSKIPALKGDTRAQVEQLRNYYNRLVDELTREMNAKDAEIERLRKEIRGREKK